MEGGTQIEKRLSDVYSEGFMQLGQVYADFYKRGKLTLEMMVNLSTIRSCLVTVYYEMVRLNLLTAIEKIPKEDKDELWKEANKFKEKLNKKQKVDFCRAIWALENLL